MLNTIYKITNMINGKVYIGKTSCEISKRFDEHIKDSKRKKHGNRPLYNAMNKYGVDNFVIETIESNISDEEINDKEIYYIQKFNSYVGFVNSNGYNATLGGDSKKYKKIDISRIIFEYQKGMSLKEISELHHIDRTYVSRLLKANNIFPKSSGDSRSKEVRQLDIDTNKVISIYPSTKYASISLVGDESARHKIDNAARKYQRSALGYAWEFSV